MTIRTNQSNQTRDIAIVQCLRIFARRGKKVRMQRKSFEQEPSLENKNTSAEKTTSSDYTTDMN